MIWNTPTVLKAIESVPGVISVKVLDDGEDYTTDSVYVTVAGTENHLWICGFVTSGQPLSKHDDVPVEMIELTTGYSDGDMPSDPPLILAHAHIRCALIKAGFSVVNSLDPYF